MSNAPPNANYTPAYLLGGISLGLFVVCLPFLTVPASKKLGSLPWMATPHRTIQRLFSVPAIQQGKRDLFVDLGSGDGRLVIEAARQGYALSIGHELNPVLIGMSYINAARAGVLGRVRFSRRDFWTSDLDQADVVSCFGVNSIMGRLHAKLEERRAQNKQLPTTLVCLFRFNFPDSVINPGTTLVHRDVKHELFVYKM